MSDNRFNKIATLTAGLAAVAVIFIIQLFRLQIVEDDYKISADNNALIYTTIYPARGLILDRDGKIMAGNKVAYDIMVTPADVSEFDTTAFCSIFDLEEEYVKERFRDFKKNKRKIGYRTLTFLKQATGDQYNRFSELSYKFHGFNAIPRSIRDYPMNACGNLLGYVTEVDTAYIRRNPGYRSGDFAGKTGLEMICEKELRGEKGLAIYLRDVHNRILSDFENGKYDKNAIPGKDIHTTIDAELQQYIEYLMENKIGSVVAIEPATGEILAMVSSPGIGTDKLAEISRHYSEIASDPLKPMYNRAIMSPYPPGSVMKILNGLIALQEHLITPATRFDCHRGYTVGNFHLNCHNHKSRINLNESIMMSCNAYYCYVLRDILDNPKYGNISEAMNFWSDAVKSFGFGSPLGCELPSEQGGNIPDAETYNRTHGKNRWKSLSVISLAIGQGEIGATPLQIANYAACLANRGYYITPHILKDGVHPRPEYTQRHYTAIDTSLFELIIPGMYNAVNKGPQDGATAWRAKVEGLDICGKTGTAQNPHGEDHSVFIGFAPKDRPEVAIVAFIENAGFGGTWAAPIGSLSIEKYLTDSTSRKQMEQYIHDSNLIPAKYRKK